MIAIALWLLGLTVVWVLAWGSLSIANVLGGLAVGVVLLWTAPDHVRSRGPMRVAPVAVARFAGYVVVAVLRSNVVLARQVLARRTRLCTGVVEVPLPDCSDGVVTVIANVLALTPGTNPVQVTRHPTVLHVHVLQLHDVEAIRRDVQHLADLVMKAFAR